MSLQESVACLQTVPLAIKVQPGACKMRPEGGWALNFDE